jgi:hypothetical protein
MFGAAADHIALVVRANVTRREEVTAAIRLLGPYQRKLRGAVLTADASAPAQRSV